MNDHENAPLMDHTVDGISELDNRLPRWWVWLFYITIGFSVVYLAYFHVIGVGISAAERYNDAMGIAVKPTAPTEPVEATIPLDPTEDTEILARGETIFRTQCVTCHGPEGQGLIGPNMCDDYFKHGPNFEDCVHTIQNGVPVKGMIPWKTVLKPDQIYAVANYSFRLRGTSPPNPKDPEGDHYPPEE